MNFKTLNKEHKEILDDFTNDVEGFIYRITDDQNHKAFRYFKPVITNAKTLHNNIGKELKKMDILESDWIYMFPNYLLFAGIGFAAGIKNKDNEQFIEYETEQLFELIRETINDLEFMNDKRIMKNQVTNQNKKPQTKKQND